METKQILGKILTDIINRKEIFNVSIDRGEGEGMQIEKWMLIEMLANLIKLKDDKLINSVEGEHKYPQKENRNFEHCDLWWIMNNIEHWLEVKTIVLAKDAQKGSLEDISKDLDKIDRLRNEDIFHHLSIIFPVEEGEINNWKENISKICYKRELRLEEVLEYEIWTDKSIIFLLFTK